MECGGLSGMEGGTVLMLLLLVGSLDCISHTLVCSHDVENYCKLTLMYTKTILSQGLICSVLPILDVDLDPFYLPISTVMELNQDYLIVALIAPTILESAIQVMLV